MKFVRTTRRRAYSTVSLELRPRQRSISTPGMAIAQEIQMVTSLAMSSGLCRSITESGQKGSKSREMAVQWISNWGVNVGEKNLLPQDFRRRWPLEWQKWLMLRSHRWSNYKTMYTIHNHSHWIRSIVLLYFLTFKKHIFTFHYFLLWW